MLCRKSSDSASLYDNIRQKMLEAGVGFMLSARVAPPMTPRCNHVLKRHCLYSTPLKRASLLSQIAEESFAADQLTTEKLMAIFTTLYDL